MNNALIGYTGFIGSSLLKQTSFDCVYRSTNIDSIRGESFNLVVCCGASAQKWYANQNPSLDREKIESLISSLQEISCNKFILISTVDVFNSPKGVTEESFVDEVHLNPYGLHRRMLEKFVIKKFSNCLIVRLPGLVGPGLRKNVIYDLLNSNNLESPIADSVYQFYPIVNLWQDIQIALSANLGLIHLTAAPISVAEIAREAFNKKLHFDKTVSKVIYDFQTKYSNLFGHYIQYQYSKKESLIAIRTYAQSEPLDIK